MKSGTAFYHRTTPAYDGNNSTAYDEERLRMPMIIIDSGTEFDMRCLRIDATPLQDDESVGATVPGNVSSLGTNAVPISLAALATLLCVI